MELGQLLFWCFALVACGGAVSVAFSQNVVRMAVSLIVSLSAVSGIFFLLGADFVGATQLMVYVGGTVVLLIFGVMLTASSPNSNIKTSPADAFLAGGIGVLFLAMIGFTLGTTDWTKHAQVLASSKTVAVDAASDGPTLDMIPNQSMYQFSKINLTGISSGGADGEEVRVYVSHKQKQISNDATNKTSGFKQFSTAKLTYLSPDDHGILSLTRAKDVEGVSTVSVVVETTGPDKKFETGDEKKIVRTFDVVIHSNNIRRIALSLVGIRTDASTTYLLPFEIVSMHLLVVLVGAAYLARTKRKTNNV